MTTMKPAQRPRPASAPSANEPVARNDARQQRALRRGALAALIGGIATWLLFRYWQAHANPYAVLHRLYVLSYLIGLGLIAVGWYAWRYAGRIRAAGQYPPPGGWVLGATRVQTGSAALGKARQVMVSAVALTLLGLYALYLPHSISAMFPVKAPIQIDLPLASPPAAPAPAASPASRPAPATPASGHRGG